MCVILHGIPPEYVECFGAQALRAPQNPHFAGKTMDQGSYKSILRLFDEKAKLRAVDIAGQVFPINSTVPMSAAAIQCSLARMVKTGALVRLSHGLYALPTEDSYTGGALTLWTVGLMREVGFPNLMAAQHVAKEYREKTGRRVMASRFQAILEHLREKGVLDRYDSYKGPSPLYTISPKHAAVPDPFED